MFNRFISMRVKRLGGRPKEEKKEEDVVKEGQG